jgi:excisionase family DNA binding protein
MSEATSPTWMPDSPLLLDKRQVAALLNISERSVGNLIANKQLPVVRIGSRCLIRRTSIEALLQKRELKTH